MPKQQTTDKYSQSGAYKLTCQDCNKAYVGQTGRSFLKRFKEHRQAFTSNSYMSNYARHHRTDTPLTPFRTQCSPYNILIKATTSTQ